MTVNTVANFEVVSTNGVRLAAYDFGGDGPTVVFCHATGFCAHTLAPMIEAMTPRFRCVSFDFRGHGHTELPDGVSVAWSAMTQDFLAVVRHITTAAGTPGEPVLAVGHSMGGASIVMAEVANPGTISRAWMYEPILLPRGPELIGANSPDIAVGARRRTASFGSVEQIRERYSTRPPLSVLDPRVLDQYIEHGFHTADDGSLTLRCRPDVEASVFEHHQAGGFEAALAIDKPILAGAASTQGMVGERIEQVSVQNPMLKMIEYPGLTHFGPLEQPETMAADATEFLLAEGE